MTSPKDKDYLLSAIDPKNAFIIKTLSHEKKLYTMGISVRGDPFAYES